MTDAAFYAWLKSQCARRCALVEVDTDTPRYLSTVPYTTQPTDSPSNRAFLCVVAGSFAFTEKLSLTGNASISAGDIELHNEDGMLDGWLNDVWVNRAIRVYIGDVSWPRADFKQVFSGVVGDLGSRNTGRLNISIRSKLDRLNTPVSEALLGGDSPNAGRLLPLCFGECHNISPLLIDPSNHVYQVHQGAIERLIEVRDNGVPVTVTPDLSAGKFTLTKQDAGQITVSAQGKTPYTNTVPGIIRALVTQYGTPDERFTEDDIDAVNFAAFEAANPAPVGKFLGDRGNVFQVCQELAASLGAQLVVSRLGLLRLLMVQSVTSADFAITPDNYELGSLTIRQRTEVVAGVRLGYCKNWQVQESLDTGIPAEHKDLFGQEWLTVSARDSDVAQAYKLYADPAQVDVLLLDKDSAQAEADRRLALWKVPRTTYRINGFAELLQLELGQAVGLQGSRFGLNAGRAGQVVGLESDWIGGRVSVEVLV